MNAPYPIPGSQTNPASFVADTTLNLGSYDKPVDAQTLISVDYSQLVPAIAIKKYSFRVSPGGEPQLEIANSAIVNSANNLLQFFILGGIAGQAYEITIITRLVSSEARSDTLTINVLEDGGYTCPPSQSPTPLGIGQGVSGDGSIIVNTSPRFFISSTPPASANVLDRWYDTTTGQVYDYISNGILTQWALAGSGGGGSGGGGGTNIVSILPITPDGVTTTFNLSAIGGQVVSVTAANTLFVSVDGVWQQANVSYSAVNNMIQFLEPPTVDAVIFILWFS